MAARSARQFVASVPQRRLDRRGPRRTHDRSLGIRVAQVHLGSVLDDSMSQAGSGDTGGVATLLSRLGGSLAAQSRIAEVITIGRAAAPGDDSRSPTAGKHRFEQVPLQAGEGTSFIAPWPALVAAQRGIRSAVLANGLPDVMHLRMADPGSLAAALVAQELGIPTVFTLAPGSARSHRRCRAPEHVGPTRLRARRRSRSAVVPCRPRRTPGIAGARDRAVSASSDARTPA